MTQPEPERRPILEAFVAFVSAPTPEKFTAVRGLILASPHYDPYCDQLSQYITKANAMLEGAEPIAALPPPFNGLLNVKAHLLQAMLHKKAGNTNGYNMEMMFAVRIGDGIMATGAGTMASPFKVLCTADEYDVLMLKNETMERQALMRQDGRQIDVLHCAGNKEFCFDVTDLFTRMEQITRGINLPPKG